jgi:hypothetical protein
MVWLHNVHGVPENVMGDVRCVMMNPLKYLHLEGEGEALEAMILFRNGRWSAGRGQEELFELMVESGMVDNWGQLYDEECEARRLLDTDEGIDEEHEKAYEDWVASGEDISGPSYFSDYVGFPEPVGTESPGFAMMEKMGWSPGEGLGQGGIVDPICKMIPSLLRDDRGNVVMFSPEMLEQREQLNWNFNFLWNGFGFCEGTTNHPTGDYVPPIHCEDVEIVSIGDNHGVGKCKMGSVFIPKGALNYLGPDAYVGQGIQATLVCALEGARYPWRIMKNGITCVGITYAK